MLSNLLPEAPTECSKQVRAELLAAHFVSFHGSIAGLDPTLLASVDCRSHALNVATIF